MTALKLSHILAPTDLSRSSVRALRHARFFADRFGATLTVLYSDPIMYPVDVMGEPQVMLLAASETHANELREELAKFADPVMEGAPYEAMAGVGQPIAAIIRAAEDRHADLIVMGTHARHGWRRAVLGSVSEGVLHASHCPVLMVGSLDSVERERTPHVSRVICPVNFTETAKISLTYAAEMAKAFEAELLVVHVVEPEEGTAPRDQATQVREWAAPIAGNVTAYRELVMRGGAAERVLDCAEDLGADLLVVGAQHRVFRDATVIGTTTERLIRFAACPVLVVPNAAVKRSTTQETKQEQVEPVHV